MKIGDRVKVIDKSQFHKFNTGEIVTCVEDPHIHDCGLFRNERGTIQYLSPNDYEIIKETKTMKYKVGDKVKITGNSNNPGFSIGETVKILEVFRSHHYRAEYLDGRDWWYVNECDIEPVQEQEQEQSKFITRPKNYTGCDPDIAAALKQGLEIYCEVWDDYDEGSINPKYWVSDYIFGTTFPYAANNNWKHARPIIKKKIETRVKKASEIFAWLENPENDYYLDEDGDWSHTSDQRTNPSFVPGMVKHCGTADPGIWQWHPSWLEEVEISEDSEN